MDDDGWQPVPGVGEPAETIQFDTLDFLDELANPIRARIMRRLKRPNTIAAVAEALSVPVTRLYHHVNRLEAAGVIRVVATRQVGSVIERRYQVVARAFQIAPEYFESRDSAEVAAAVGSIYDMAKLGLQREIETGTLDFTEDDDSTTMSFGHLMLTPARQVELQRRLEELLADFTSDAADDDPDATRVALFIASHPETD